MHIFNIYTIKFWQSILAQERVEGKCSTLVKPVAWEDLLCHLDPRSVVTRGGHWESCYQSQHTQGQSTSSDIRRLLCRDPESCSCPRQTRAQAACLSQGLPLTVASPASRPPPVFLDLPFSYSRHASPLLSWGQAQLLMSMPANMPVLLSLPTVLTLADTV